MSTSESNASETVVPARQSKIGALKERVAARKGAVRERWPVKRQFLWGGAIGGGLLLLVVPLLIVTHGRETGSRTGKGTPQSYSPVTIGSGWMIIDGSRVTFSSAIHEYNSLTHQTKINMMTSRAPAWIVTLTWEGDAHPGSIDTASGGLQVIANDLAKSSVLAADAKRSSVVRLTVLKFGQEPESVTSGNFAGSVETFLPGDAHRDLVVSEGEFSAVRR